MQAILQSKHQKFLDWIQDVKIKQPGVDEKLSELEDGLQLLYGVYQQKMQEIKLIIEEYEITQKATMNEIKRSRRNGLFIKK